MQVLAIVLYIVATTIIFASLPDGGVLAHPLGEELASAQMIDDLTGRTLIKFALVDGRAILGSRNILCDCCANNNNSEDTCCGQNFYGTCSCVCCDGCRDDGGGDFMKLVAAKKRRMALKEAQLKRKHINDASAGAQDFIVKKHATTLAGAAMAKKSAEVSGTPRALYKVGEAKVTRAQDHATVIVKKDAAISALNVSVCH